MADVSLILAFRLWGYEEFWGLQMGQLGKCPLCRFRFLLRPKGRYFIMQNAKAPLTNEGSALVSRGVKMSELRDSSAGTRNEASASAFSHRDKEQRMINYRHCRKCGSACNLSSAVTQARTKSYVTSRKRGADKVVR